MHDPLAERPRPETDWGAVVGGSLGLIWLGVAAFYGSEWWTLTQLVQRGIPTPARVTSATIEGTGRRSEDVIHYEFTAPDGTRRSGVERFSRGRSPDLDPGELAAVFYKGALEARFLPDDPSVHRLNLGFPLRLSNARLYTCCQLVFALAALGWSAWRFLRRRE